MYQQSSSYNFYQNGHYPYSLDDRSSSGNRLLQNYNWNHGYPQQLQPSLASTSPYYNSALNKRNHDDTIRSMKPPSSSMPTSPYLGQQPHVSQQSFHSCMHGLSSNSMATGRTDMMPPNVYYPGGK